MGKRGPDEIVDSWAEDPAFKRWITKLEKRDPEGNIINQRTLTNSKYGFRLWMDFIKIEPQKQIEMRAEHVLSRDPAERNFWEGKMQDFKRFCYTLKNRQGKRYASNSVKGFLKAPASFFRHNGYRLMLEIGYWTDIEPAPREKVLRKWVPSNEEIRLIYKRAESYRDKALLLVLYQSGFSPIDVSALRIEHFPDLYVDRP